MGAGGIKCILQGLLIIRILNYENCMSKGSNIDGQWHSRVNHGTFPAAFYADNHLHYLVWCLAGMVH
jgi:hypothetical protein